MTLRALIVEDEPLARERLSALLEQSSVEVVGEAESAPVATAQLDELRPDLLFVDIEIPGQSGVEFVRALEADQRPAVIFTTAHPQYALEAFDVGAVDYLVKPLDREHVCQAIKRARRLIAGGRAPARLHDVRVRERFAVRKHGEIIFIKAVQIEWISAEGNYSRIHSGSNSYLLRETLQTLESALNPATFLRVHRSAIVNLDRIHKLVTSADGAPSIVLVTGDMVPLGPSYRSRLEETIGQKL